MKSMLFNKVTAAFNYKKGSSKHVQAKSEVNGKGIVWNKLTEEHFKAHKKEVYKTRNSVLNKSNTGKSNYLTADLASIFLVARNQFKQPETTQNPKTRIGSLKQLNDVHDLV
jgi:hypothetical protein